MHDLLIEGGHVVTATWSSNVDIAISEGRVTAVGETLVLRRNGSTHAIVW